MKIRSVYFILSLSIILFACQKDNDNSLMVFTGEVNSISYGNIEFTGRMQLAQNIKINDHGFILSVNSPANIIETISLGEINNCKNFTFNYQKLINSESEYFIHAYIKIDDNRFFGEPVSFQPFPPDRNISLLTFYPEAVYLNEPLTIEGLDLFSKNENIKVFINDIQCEEILRTEKKIQVIIPLNIVNSPSQLIISIDGILYVIQEKIIFKEPILESINQIEGYPNDTIIIRGDYLGNIGGTSILGIDKTSQYQIFTNIVSVEKTKIVAIHPSFLSQSPTKLLFTILGRKVFPPFNYYTSQPIIDNISPKAANFLDTLTISGRNFRPNDGLHNIRVLERNGGEQKIVFSNATKIQFIINNAEFKNLGIAVEVDGYLSRYYLYIP